jgi:hypothetical protein
MTERIEEFDSEKESSDREIYKAIFEHVCTQASERFKERGAHEPLLLVLTRLGVALIPIEMEEGAEREPIARSIRENIRRTAINAGGEPVYDEPLAVILASEAWMVEYDEGEDDLTAQLPPRLHPRRKEILQVTLRTRELSFSRNWPIIRKSRSVRLGERVDLGGEGMESVWDLILTG